MANPGQAWRGFVKALPTFMVGVVLGGLIMGQLPAAIDAPEHTCRNIAPTNQDECARSVLAEQRAGASNLVGASTQVSFIDGQAKALNWRFAVTAEGPSGDGSQYWIDMATRLDSPVSVPQVKFVVWEDWSQIYNAVPWSTMETADLALNAIQILARDSGTEYASLALVSPKGSSEPFWLGVGGAFPSWSTTATPLASAFVARIGLDGVVLDQGAHAMPEYSAFEAAAVAASVVPPGYRLASARAFESRELVLLGDPGIPSMLDSSAMDGKSATWLLRFGQSQPNKNIVIAVQFGQAVVLEADHPGHAAPDVPLRALYKDSVEAASRVRASCEWSPADVELQVNSSGLATYWFNDDSVDAMTGAVSCGRSN